MEKNLITSRMFLFFVFILFFSLVIFYNMGEQEGKNWLFVFVYQSTCISSKSFIQLE